MDVGSPNIWIEDLVQHHHRRPHRLVLYKEIQFIMTEFPGMAHGLVPATKEVLVKDLLDPVVHLA